jgi:hypothetical protein
MHGQSLFKNSMLTPADSVVEKSLVEKEGPSAFMKQRNMSLTVNGSEMITGRNFPKV